VAKGTGNDIKNNTVGAGRCACPLGRHLNLPERKHNAHTHDDGTNRSTCATRRHGWDQRHASPQQRKEKERQKLISELRAGQRILFGGGLIGTVAEVKEHSFMVEVSPKVTIEIARGAVARVLNTDEKPVLEDAR
jgi:preprotein translocase YajC subunit